jgi:hypothetical protein
VASKSDLTNPSSTRSLPPARFRFCRSIPKELSPERAWLTSDIDQSSSVGYRAEDIDLVSACQHASSRNSIVTVRDVTVVRYQPVIATGGNRWEAVARGPHVISTVVLLVAAYCFLQLPGLLREMRTADERRSAAVERLALSLAQQDQRLQAANAGLKNLSRKISQLNAANSARQLSQVDALESPLSKRSPGDPPATPIPAEPLPPAQTDYAFNSAVPIAPGAVVHRNEKGDPDYWLIQRPGETTMAKVIPLDVTTLGVSVHRIDDDRNYILTMNGGWMGSN